MRLCGQQGFPSSYSSPHTKMQCKAKGLFLAVSISFCVRAVWHGPWCFLEGSFQLSACWKSWQSHWQKTSQWRIMTSFFFFAVLKFRKRNEHWQSEEGRCGTSGFHFAFYLKALQDDFHSRYVWIPHIVTDIMQRFLNKLHPAVKAVDKTVPRVW